MDSYLSTGHDESEKSGSVSPANKLTFDFTERTWKEDFALIVEDKTLYVTKALLAFVSPVFEKMFKSDFKEKDQAEMELPGKKFDDVLEFLRCIYPGVMADVSEQNVYKLLPLADEYQVYCLKSKCEMFLISRLKEMSTNALYDMLQYAITYNMEDLLETCKTKVSNGTVADLEIAVKRLSLPLETKCAIQDKMVRRLEETEKEKRWLEAAYKFLFSGLKAAEKRKIGACAGWTGVSLEFPLVVAELNRPDIIWQSKEFKIFDMEACCSVNRQSGYDYLELQISIDENQLKGWDISVVGRFVIKSGTKNEDSTGTFQMTFKDGSSLQLRNMSSMDYNTLFNDASGYIHKGKMEAEVHLLAEKKISQ